MIRVREIAASTNFRHASGITVHDKIEAAFRKNESQGIDI